LHKTEKRKFYDRPYTPYTTYTPPLVPLCLPCLRLRRRRGCAGLAQGNVPSSPSPHGETAVDLAAECCLLGPRAQVKAGALYSAFDRWACDNGLEAMSRSAFSKHLARRRPDKSRHEAGWVYHGLGLRAGYADPVQSCILLYTFLKTPLYIHTVLESFMINYTYYTCYTALARCCATHLHYPRLALPLQLPSPS